MHALLLDVDGFEPLSTDALTDPDGAINEFVVSMLPAAFSGAGYHWHLSGSAGHASKGGALRAHLWFWLETPLTSAQLKSYAEKTGLACDMALFNPVQCHYTANPVMGEGVTDLYTERSGYVSGVLGDALGLDVPREVMEADPVVSGGGRGQRLRDLIGADPIALTLYGKDMVRAQRRDGGLNVECPFKDEHTGDSGESSTIYYPPNTGGYPVGNFKCLHTHCGTRRRGEFLARLGIDESEQVQFENLDAQDGSDSLVDRKGIPEARRLTTDQANANRIVKQFGKRIIVVAERWYAWTGKRWENDDGEVSRYASQLSKMIDAEADAWSAKRAKDDDEARVNRDVAKALRAWGMRSEMKSCQDAAIGLLRKMLTFPSSLLDRSPWLLNCPNGTVDLRTGAIKPHDPDDFITRMISVDYDPTAPANTWDKIIGRITMEEGRTTRPVAAFLQRWFGYCATGDIREHKFVVHYGQGSNGKSTLLDTIQDVLGDYSATAAPGLMVSTAKDKHPTEIADLFGRRMVTAHESGEGGYLREDFIKQATGGDKIKARYMRMDFFEFHPTHKLQLLTNHKPIIKGQDNGIWRRVLLVPYEARFASYEEVNAGRAHFIKDTKTAEYIKAELPGVLAWIVKGAQMWFQDGLQEPDSVLAASRDYQTEQDRVQQFVNECCVTGKDKRATINGPFGVYEAYRKWCVEGGIQALSRRKLVTELERVVFHFRAQGHKKAVRGTDGTRNYACEGIELIDEALC
jgi:putative DNA primase/helicase